MVRRSPAEQYIKYLIVHPDGYTNDHIQWILFEDKLDFIGNWYVNKLRERTLAPLPFYPKDLAHRPSQKFLHTECLFDFFHPDPIAKRAYDITRMARVKEIVESFLIGHMPYAGISEMCADACNFPCSPYVIQKYKHMFWNVDLLDSTEVRELFVLRKKTIANHPDPEIREMVLSEANFQKDARKIAADMPFTPMASAVVMMQFGAVPANLDHMKMAEQCSEMSWNRLYRAVVADGKGDAFRGRNYAGIIRDLHEVSRDLVKPEEQLHSKLAMIAIKTDRLDMKTLAEKTGGDHTVDMMPEREKDELPDDEASGGEGEDPIEPGDGSEG
jgi:hypothetical protein